MVSPAASLLEMEHSLKKEINANAPRGGFTRRNQGYVQFTAAEHGAHVTALITPKIHRQNFCTSLRLT